MRAQCAELLGIPLSRIKVIPLEIGGGFGGKIRVYLEPVAAVLARKAGRPVKMTMSRAEVFEGTGPTPGSYIKVKMGTAADGRLVAALATARAHPVVVDRAGAAAWVRQQLAAPVADGVLTVVWHSITRQYWPPEEYAAMLAAVDEARARMPVVRVGLEDPDPRPSTGDWQPQVEVDDDVIAHCTHHGPPLTLAPVRPRSPS